MLCEHLVGKVHILNSHVQLTKPFQRSEEARGVVKGLFQHPDDDVRDVAVDQVLSR